VEPSIFRLLQGANEPNEKLLKSINTDGRIHMVPSITKGVYYLRFAICASRTTHDDVTSAWNVIAELATKQLEEAK